MQSILKSARKVLGHLPFRDRTSSAAPSETKASDTVDIDWSRMQAAEVPPQDDQGRPHIQLLQGEHGFVKASEAASIGSGAATTCLLLLAKSEEMIGAAHIDAPPKPGELDWLKEMGPGLEVQLVGSYGISETSHEIVERVSAEVPSDSVGKCVLQDNTSPDGGPMVTDACVTSEGNFLKADYSAPLEQIPEGPYRYGRIFQSDRPSTTTSVLSGKLELKIEPYTVEETEFLQPIPGLSDEQLRMYYSTSPEHEPPQFASHLRSGATHLLKQSEQMLSSDLQTQVLKWSTEGGWQREN